jgi:hypothetical protein
MFNKHKTTLSALIVSAVLVASFFAIIFVQEALAQGNMSSSGGSNMTTKMKNMTSASGGNMTMKVK